MSVTSFERGHRQYCIRGAITHDMPLTVQLKGEFGGILYTFLRKKSFENLLVLAGATDSHPSNTRHFC